LVFSGENESSFVDIYIAVGDPLIK
jgi:hypothetical protein